MQVVDLVLKEIYLKNFFTENQISTGRRRDVFLKGFIKQENSLATKYTFHLMSASFYLINVDN